MLGTLLVGELNLWPLIQSLQYFEMVGGIAY